MNTSKKIVDYEKMDESFYHFFKKSNGLKF